MDPFMLIPYAIGGVVVLMLVVSMVIITPGKRARILETLGKPHKKARMPGMSFKLPWPLTSQVGEVNLQIREIPADVTSKTKDNAFVTLPVKVQFRASDSPEGAVLSHYELDNPEEQIESYVLNNVRQTVPKMTMDELFANRDQVEADVKESLTEQFKGFGYVVVNVLVDEPQPSHEVQKAFNRVIASEREKDAAENLAEAKRIELVGIAEAEKQSKELQGQGMAAMREAIAKGMHASMDELKKAGLSTEQALELLMDTNRLDTLGSAAHHGNMVLVDMKSGQSSMAETMAAVKATQGGKSAETPTAVPLQEKPAEQSSGHTG